ncbi:restriction endonuclease subunit S [Craterilacuibacter sp. RT1T]|uniref:restriction endonuclease subunit S n=1 Tax=Craterilacuibacter sp. RT1T TaxID=2942211 RepID=UPI0020BD77DE|nr:restriction endonuclease subunit S [Craterilacuibacter sp. RT1T]MCL6262905.1 restriction endonuclease subunit S [Craterilacuibacter sp. RT1T]
MSPIDSLITDHLDLWTAAVRPKSSAGRGSNSKLELTGIKKLRELILELAVRGKLVPQDPSDEPASVLLERIAAEKAQLVIDGKIKKPKALPEIGEEEKPFELPEGWEWCRLDELSLTSEAGWSPLCDNTPRKNEQWGVLKVSAVTWGKFLAEENKALPEPLEPKPEYEVLPGDFLISRANTAELVARAVIAPANTPCKLMMSDKIIRFRFSHFVNSSYICLANGSCTSREYYSRVAGGTSSSMKNVSRLQIQNLVIALPPLSEQKRILDNCEKLMALCDHLEQRSESQLAAHQTLVEALLATLTDSADADELAQNWARLVGHFDTLFTTDASIDALKQTILQLAVMGKLVTQDPSDEPASVLLERIAAEKARLVKEKKIKNEKPLPAISEDEKPFELPLGWEWCRFEDVVDIQSGITKGRKLTNRELVTVPYLSVANVQRGFVDVAGIKSVELPVDEIEKYQVLAGDLLITEGGDWDKVGRTAIWADEMPYVAHQNHVFKARKFLQEQDESWLEMFLNGPSARDYFAGSSKQTTNLASINKTQLRGCLIAIPPKNEKSCIVAKVDELMTLCDQLTARLQTSQQTQLALAETLMEGTLA